MVHDQVWFVEKKNRKTKTEKHRNSAGYESRTGFAWKERPGIDAGGVSSVSVMLPSSDRVCPGFDRGENPRPVLRRSLSSRSARAVMEIVSEKEKAKQKTIGHRNSASIGSDSRTIIGCVAVKTRKLGFCEG